MSVPGSLVIALHNIEQAMKILKPDFTLAKNRFEEELEIWNSH